MIFNSQNFRNVEYDGLTIFFDKNCSFHEHFQHKRKTKKFLYYKNILQFLTEEQGTRIFFTLNEEIKSFQKVDTGFLINMDAYQLFCRSIGSKTGGRLKAFLGQNLSLKDASATEVEKSDFIKANATEKNILEAVKTLPPGEQGRISNALNSLSPAASNSTSEFTRKEFVASFARFLTDKEVQGAFIQNLPKIQIGILKSHISFLKSNLDKDETFIQNWIDEDDGKLRKQRCLIFGLEYIDPKREGQVAGKKFDILAEHDLEHYVIFELKSPKDNVFKVVERAIAAGGISSEYHLSSQLARAIPEVLGYKKMYEKAQGEELQKFGIQNKKEISKCVIILGTRIDDQVWKENFERVSSSLNGIELLTYNHLIDRLQNTVDNLEKYTQNYAK